MPWRDFLRSDGITPVGGYLALTSGDHERILSVVLSPDLFDTPRTIDVTLNRPDPFVRPANIWGQFSFRYHALISRRMQHSEVPRWNDETRKFLAPAPPVLRVRDVATGALLQESEMLSMCYGHGWVLRADLPAELPHNTRLEVVVAHETGDLFGELKAECSFTYRDAFRH